ncbi:MAG: DUF1206 domain-containing protein [Actinomycetota bacterium]|nr:DUF1206 domain-containing protein [Actinomycetota bacterium]
MTSDAERWLGRLGRFGLAARGVVYILIGWLALKIANGHPGQQADRQGALHALVSKPFGKIVLIAVAAGFIGYAAWRLADAFLGATQDKKTKWPVRFTKAVRGLLYVWFAFGASKIAMSNQGGNSSNQQAHRSSAQLLHLPAGKWIVMLLGISFIAAGLYNGVRAVTGKFFKDMKEQQMGELIKRILRVVGTGGFLARMVAFGLIGLFYIRSGLARDPNQAIGIDGALKKVLSQSHGGLLLSVVAIGLAAFGIFSLAQSKYRSTDVEAA